MVGNMYEVAADETWELFGSFLEGAHAGLVAIVSAAPLATPARTALISSAAALGYGREACTFVTIAPADGSEAEGARLDPQSLFLILEGTDPICLVATDSPAAALISSAYRCPIEPGKASRALGRTVVAFKDFTALLATPQNKQVAWALLKKLPKLEER